LGFESHLSLLDQTAPVGRAAERSNPLSTYAEWNRLVARILYTGVFA